MTEASRRDFLRGGFLRGLFKQTEGLTAPIERAVAAMDRLERPAPPPIPILRPPGAVAEPAFLAGCTRCNDCATACPHQAITPAPPRLRGAAGTPMIDPHANPCLMCTDTPCITACEPRVLRREPGQPVPTIGTARIELFDCLAHQNGICMSCSERCPVPGAITLTLGKPFIQADVCTGCGICASVCPAPRPAIAILPRQVR